MQATETPPTKPRSKRLFVSVEEAARRLGIGYSTAKRMVQNGELPSTKIGARRVVPVAALERLVAEAMGEAEDA